MLDDSTDLSGPGSPTFRRERSQNVKRRIENGECLLNYLKTLANQYLMRPAESTDKTPAKVHIRSRRGFTDPIVDAWGNRNKRVALIICSMLLEEWSSSLFGQVSLRTIQIVSRTLTRLCHPANLKGACLGLLPEDKDLMIKSIISSLDFVIADYPEIRCVKSLLKQLANVEFNGQRVLLWSPEQRLVQKRDGHKTSESALKFTSRTSMLVLSPEVHTLQSVPTEPPTTL